MAQGTSYPIQTRADDGYTGEEVEDDQASQFPWFTHWIFYNADYLEYIETSDAVQIYSAAHDPETQTHSAHFHILFDIDRKQFSKKGFFIRELRRRYGCKETLPLTQKQLRRGNAKEIKCCDSQGTQPCPKCGFYLKETKPIHTWSHASNCFQYIKEKVGSVHDTRSIFEEVDTNNIHTEEFEDDPDRNESDNNSPEATDTESEQDYDD